MKHFVLAVMSLPVGLIVLLVLMALCAILGIIYSYIYFTRISPPGRWCANRKTFGSLSRNDKSAANMDDQSGGSGGGGGLSVGTHMFLMRKS